MRAEAKGDPRGAEIEELRLRLAEAEQTLEAIRAGEVDSLVVEGPAGLRVYALEGASNTYRVMIEAINEGAATLTENGVILYSNGRFARMLDRPLQRIMGSSIRELVPERVQPALDALLRSANGGESRSEITLLGAGGAEVPAYLSVSGIQEEDRRILCLVATDLRAQKRNAEILAAERLARSVLEQAAEAIVVCDDRARIIRASRSAAELCACNPLRMSFADAFPVVLAGDGEPSVRNVADHALSGRTLRAVPATLPRAGREDAELLVSAAPLYGESGGTLGCVITMVDVTERRRAERAVREADQRKDQFLAVLSHELRNPLAPIMTSLYVLERSVPGSEQAKRAQAVIARQVGQLVRLVDDLLDITRIARNQIELKRERIDLNGLVQATVEDYRALFEQSGVRLSMELAPEEVTVQGDTARLAQVIGNLLQNSAKFTSAGGSATVSVSTSPDVQQALVRVSDTGAGMTPEVLERLFEPFTQADTTLDRRQGGLGLGLALVKALVEKHGGQVTAHSAGPGRGTEVLVKLPLEEKETEQQAAETAKSPARRRVLVIEDNVDAAESLRDVLELAEHDVQVAYEGRAGLARAREQRPEVVLCDIGLPEMDGYEVARAFRADATLQSAYLVALTGYARPEDVRKAKEAGFDSHIAKPPSLQKLEQVFERAASGESARAE